MPLPIHTDRAEFNRLILQIERDLVSQGYLRELVVKANGTVALHRRELAAVRKKIAQAERRRKLSATARA